MPAKKRIFMATLLILYAAGAFIAYVLAETYYFGESGGEDFALFSSFSEQMCGGDASFFSCGSVSRSKFAVLFGIPLAVYGLFIYVSLFLSSVLLLISKENRRKYPAMILVWGASFASVFNIVLLFISLFSIKALCPLCLITYAVSWASLALLYFTLKDSGTDYFDFMNIFRSFRSEAGKARLVLTLAVIPLISLPSALGADLWLKGTKDRAVKAKIADGSSKVLSDFYSEKPIEIKYDSFMVVGDPKAPVTIVEITDFLCPFCSKASGVLEEVLKENPGKVKLFLVNYPLDINCNVYMKNRMHAGACELAKGSICAARLGKLDEYMSYAFFTGERVSDPELPRILAALMNADEKKWLSCFDSAETEAALRAQIDAAKAIDITGTPRIYINGRKYNFRPIKEYISMLIDEEIKRAGK